VIFISASQNQNSPTCHQEGRKLETTRERAPSWQPPEVKDARRTEPRRQNLSKPIELKPPKGPEGGEAEEFEEFGNLTPELPIWIRSLTGVRPWLAGCPAAPPA
jgi:hypothetical protein